jgi:hypothetical protein
MNALTPLQKQIIGHASLVLLAALIAGLGLTASLLGGWEFIPGIITEFSVPGTTEAWARAHAGGILNAVMMVAFGLLIPGLGFGAAVAGRLKWMLIGTGWANTVFYYGALFAPNRAISFADNRWGPSNLASIIGLLPALIFAFVMIYVAIVFARQAFAGDD